MPFRHSHERALCLACGASPTIRAHLIPQAFAREVRNGGNKLALMMPKFRSSQNGLFDDSILCQECDSRLGENEKYAVETFRRLRNATTSKLNTHVRMPAIGDRLVRFAAGISWKYCITKTEYGRINVGPYADLLKNVALSKGNMPPAIDMFMIRLKALKYEECFFRAPKPDRHSGINFIRLTLGAFLMFLKIDKRPSPIISTPELWMRARTDVTFPVLPMDMFEEGLFVKERWRQDKKLAEFFLGDFGKNAMEGK